MTNDKSLESPATRPATTMIVDTSASFQAFDAWMDGALDQLVARWAHAAAPSANRVACLSERRARHVDH